MKQEMLLDSSTNFRACTESFRSIFFSAFLLLPGGWKPTLVSRSACLEQVSRTALPGQRVEAFLSLFNPVGLDL